MQIGSFSLLIISPYGWRINCSCAWTVSKGTATKERVSSMRKKEYVELPELPTVEMIVLLDRPGIIFINLSCIGTGEIRIVPAETKEQKNVDA